MRTHRCRRLLVAFLALIGLPLLVAALVYANRPHRITYISPPLKGTNLRLSVQMLDTWTPEKWEIYGGDYGVVRLEFRKGTPFGFNRSLLFYIKTGVRAQDHLTFSLRCRSKDDKDVSAIIKRLQGWSTLSSPPALIPIRQFQFPLGPAVEGQVPFHTFFGSDGVWDDLTILPGETALNKKLLEVGLQYQGDKKHLKEIHPTFLEAAQRVRLTTTKPNIEPEWVPGVPSQP